MFKIEHNIPIPPITVVPKYTKYPFKNMQIGDSIFVPDYLPEIVTIRATVAAHRYARTNNKKFTTRRVANGTRIWRVE